MESPFYEEELRKQIIQQFEKLGYQCNDSSYDLEKKAQEEIRERLNQMEEPQILKNIKKGMVMTPSIGERIWYYGRKSIIDFDNPERNQFGIISEVKSNENRYDCLLTINGIPLVIIECSQNVDRACMQLQNSFFRKTQELKTVQLLVAMDIQNIKYKATSQESVWKTWHISQQKQETWQERIRALFKKEAILDIIQNYILWMGEKKEVATYYQYYATQRILQDKSKQRKVCLTTGSGKTTAILFLIEKIKKQENPLKILIVVERLVMQEMLKEKIKKSIQTKVEIARSKLELEEMLHDLRQEIIITTRQKLQLFTRAYFGEIYLLTDMASYYGEQMVEEKAKECFPTAILMQYTSNKIGKENYIYHYSEGQAMQDEIITKLFYANKKRVNEAIAQNYASIKQVSKDTIRNVVEDIKNYFKNYYSEEKKVIIVTKKTEEIAYIKALEKENYLVAATSLEEEKDNEFLQDMIRDNGSLENYKQDSRRNFNEGKIEILVVTSKEELTEITTSKVHRIYLTRTVESNMLPSIFKILMKKDLQKERGVIVDYADNREKINQFTKEEMELKEKQKVIPETSCMLHEARQVSLTLLREQNKLQHKLTNVSDLNSKELLVEADEFSIKVKELMEKISFVFSSEELLNLLAEGEQKLHQERIQQYLEIIDQIAVLQAKEIKEKEFFQECCTWLKIPTFCFTPIAKSDLWKYPNLTGAWKTFNSIQKAEAIKNRLKKYGAKEEAWWLAWEGKYQANQMEEKQYEKEIEKLRKAFTAKLQEEPIPLLLKKGAFTKALYTKLKKAIDRGEIKITKAEVLYQIILEIEHILKENIKVGWKNNYYLWKKIDLKIVEMLYDEMEEEKMVMTEKALDNLLENIRTIANQTLDIEEKIKEQQSYYIQKKKAYAVAQFREDGFWVLKNSTTVEGFSPSLNECFQRMMQNLREQGIIYQNRFMQDYKFNSPSTAANIILGRSSNGKIEWKDKEGKTISQKEAEKRTWKNN